MKFGALWVHCWGLALADLERGPRSSDSLTGRRNFVIFCQVKNARFYRFPVGQISRNSNTTTSIGVAIKTFVTEFLKFYCKGSFFKKRKKSQKFQRFATLGRHNYAMITDRRIFITEWSLYGMSSFHFTVRMNSKSIPCAVRCVQETDTNFRQRPMSILGKPVRRCAVWLTETENK